MNRSVAVDRRLGLEGGLYRFIQMAWPIVVPNRKFVGGPALRLFCQRVEEVSDGKIRNLVANVPPGMTKSLTTSVFWPTWEWLRRPGTKWIHVSYDIDLMEQHARRQLDLLQSAWFRERWPELRLKNDDPARGFFENTEGGSRVSTSIQGKLTGKHADILVIDDPIKPMDIAASKVALEEVKRWRYETVPGRFDNQATGRICLVMQRLHEDDLAGVVLREQGWTHLRLPMRFEPAAACEGDWRTEPGQLLDPRRFPVIEVARLEREYGPRAFAAQMQQRPAPEAGAIFQRAWFRRLPDVPGRLTDLTMSVDAAFKGTDTSDYVAIAIVGRCEGSYVVAHILRERLTFSQTCEAILRLKRIWPKVTRVLVEDKANGPAIIDHLKKQIMGLVAINPEGGKVARANAVSHLYEAGNVQHVTGPWTDGLEEELASFPVAAHDDQVDAVTQVLGYLEKKAGAYAEAMRNVRDGSWMT